MTKYAARVDVDDKTPIDQLTNYDRIIRQLAAHSGTVGQHRRGWCSADVTIEADNLVDAAAAAIALIEGAFGRPAIACTVMPLREERARHGTVNLPLPALLSVSEAAAHLGVSRQAVLQRIEAGTLQASKVGKTYAIPAAAVTPPQ